MPQPITQQHLASSLNIRPYWTMMLISESERQMTIEVSNSTMLQLPGKFILTHAYWVLSIYCMVVFCNYELTIWWVMEPRIIFLCGGSILLGLCSRLRTNSKILLHCIASVDHKIWNRTCESFVSSSCCISSDGQYQMATLVIQHGSV